MRTEIDRTRGDYGRNRDSKWHEAALITNAVEGLRKETAGSAMNIVMKLVVLLGFLAIQWFCPMHAKAGLGASSSSAS